mmetsp:Transcript_16887/g.43359  ORF Transcript_16887/g.43359 Transcript_16887/m.43359 type:complete len:198 (+) Transcript_16887:129-722(+)
MDVAKLLAWNARQSGVLRRHGDLMSADATVDTLLANISHMVRQHRMPPRDPVARSLGDEQSSQSSMSPREVQRLKPRTELSPLANGFESGAGHSCGVPVHGADGIQSPARPGVSVSVTRSDDGRYRVRLEPKARLQTASPIMQPVSVNVARSPDGRFRVLMQWKGATKTSPGRCLELDTGTDSRATSFASETSLEVS